MRLTSFVLLVAFAVVLPASQTFAERAYSDTEKKIITAIVNDPSRNEEGMVLIARFIDDHFIGPKWGISVIIQRKPVRKVMLSIPEKDKITLQKKTIFTLTLFYLLQDLQEQGLLTLIGDSESENQQLGSQFKDGQTIDLPEPVAGIITDSLTKFAFASENLTQLVANDFKSPEQRRHQQTMVAAWISIVVAFLLGLWGVWRDLRAKKCA